VPPRLKTAAALRTARAHQGHRASGNPRRRAASDRRRTINGNLDFASDETFVLKLLNATNGAAIADGEARGMLATTMQSRPRR
jgi:hypothetical protein